jgi:hypothetical protein
LEFGFEVHKQNKGRKPLSLPPITLSLCENLSADKTNGSTFCTFKYATKRQERYNIGELGKQNYINPVVKLSVLGSNFILMVETFIVYTYERKGYAVAIGKECRFIKQNIKKTLCSKLV